MNEYPVSEQRVLYWQKMAVREMVSNSVLDRAEFDVVPDVIMPAMVASLATYVLTDHVLSRTQWAVHRVPSSWWQHFKNDVLGAHKITRWFVARYPVRLAEWTQEITFSEDRNYVDSRVLPERQFGKPVIVETVKFEEWKHNGTA